MISCEKAATICDKSQYNEAPFIDILKLRYHILNCKKCALHTKKNNKLTSLCNKANLKSLSEVEKTQMKEKLKDII